MKEEWRSNQLTETGQNSTVEQAVLIGVVFPDQTEDQTTEYLDELEFLALTAGANTCKKFIQRLNQPHPSTFIGKGKVEEISEYLVKHNIDLVIFDDDISGKQQNNLERALKCKIVDRSSLILDIFAGRAQSAQAKTQVELAQMQYLLPRLRGMWTHLERQRGGIGMRGPGEKEIETDRRLVRDKIGLLKKKLEKIDRQNSTQRKNRGELIRVALVGYTNAGKSTLMNVLSKSEVFAEDKLFATLDTTIRKTVFGRMPFLLSDTVGFIRKLPHHLVESFKSTLDETRESDLLLHVVDISHPFYTDQILTVNKTLNELGVNDRPVILVFNKMDKFRNEQYDRLLDDRIREDLEEEMKQSIQKQMDYPCVFVSATEKEGLDSLRDLMVKEIGLLYQVRYPYRVKEFE